MAATLEQSDGQYGGLRRRRDPLGVRVYSLAVSTAFVVLATLLLAVDGFVPSSLRAVLAFTAVATVADAMRVRPWADMSFSLSTPVVLAAAMVLNPGEAGVVAFLATADIREWRGDTPISRALFNRSQVGLSVLSAALVFHTFAGQGVVWPAVLPGALLCLVVDGVVNASLILWPASRLHASSGVDVLRRMFGPTYVVTLARLLCVGLMAPLIAEVWESAGTVGLFVFLLPIGLAWSVLSQAQELRETYARLETQNKALAKTLDDVAEERQDERLALAGELHDDVLPAIYNVHLLGQVLRQDLSQGRLLQLEADVPQLITATDSAQESIRSLLSATRQSVIGPTGLPSALRALAERVESSSGTRIMTHVDSVGGSPASQLVAYQVAKEALSNVLKHSRASLVIVRLCEEGQSLLLTVRDDGIGFDPRQSKPGHFGLAMMRERAAAVGGVLSFDSIVGEGSTLTLRVPREE